jgi:predicted permease
VESPDRLVGLFTSDFSGPPYGGSSYPDYYDLRAETVVFEGIASYSSVAATVGENAVAPTPALAVSANYFEVLGIRPAAGRFFTAAEEENPGDVVVLSHALATRLFGAAPGAVAQSVRVNGLPLQVIGVTPATFTGFDRSQPGEVYVPARTGFRLGFPLPGLDQRTSRGIALVARLRAGATLESARSAMQLAATRLHDAYPAEWTDVRNVGRRISVLPESQLRVPPASRGSIVSLAGVLMATVGLLLLICCANVASLLLAQTAGRAREMAIRVSLGAGGGRLIRQLFVESLLLAISGGMLGTLLAFWLTDLMTRAIGQNPTVGLPFQASIDLRVLAFAAAVSVGTGFVFGFAPALRARATDVMSVLKRDRDALAGGGRTPLRSVLVGGQLALSLPLLVGALLLARTLSNAYRIDPGFPMEPALLLNAAPLPGTSPQADPAALTQLLQERLAALPGVTSVSWGSATPLTGLGSRRGLQPVGYTPSEGEDMGIHVNHVGPGYFETVGIPMVVGRPIMDGDRPGSADVLVVNETFAERFWPGQNPIGQRISMGAVNGNPREWTVVGVARDVQFLSLTAQVLPYVWVPALQWPRAVNLFLRTAGDPLELVEPVRRVIGEVAPGWAIGRISTLDDLFASGLFAERVAGASIGLFAAIAIILAAVGLWGVIAYAVTQRTREVGIRVALGGVQRGVLSLFLRQALPVVAIGAGIGLVLSWAGSRALGGLLIGVGAGDIVTFGTAATILVGIAFLATWLPARRAAKIDPMVALRGE